MESSYSIKDLISLFLNKIWWIILVTIIGGIAGFCVSKYVMQPEYSSHISMYIQCYTGMDSDDNNYNDIAKSKQLINTYIEVLKNDSVMDAVGNSLSREFDEQTLSNSFSVSNGKISNGSLRSALSITSVTDTSAITVTATTKNAELSAALCNAMKAPAKRFTDQAIGVGSITTIDRAKVYRSPVAPNIPKNTLLGAMVGLILTMFIIVVIDFFDNTVKSAEAISKRYDKAILGEIQAIPKEKKKRKSASDEYSTLLDKDIPFGVVESCKAMRTNINFALSTSEKKIFVVSSANPGEGKSTTAINIAAAFAESGMETLLVGADLRKPVIYSVMNLKNKTGLSLAISGMKKLDECIQKSDFKHLSVLTSGPIPPNPSELLASKQAAEVFQKLSEKYDIVVIDAPPINVVSDALNLSESVAGILMVVRYGCTTNDDLKEAINRIELSKMPILGMVLNDINIKHRSGYYGKYGKYKKYGKYSDYGYGYGQKPEKEQGAAEKKS